MDEEYYVIDGYERYYSNIDFDYNRKFKNPSKFYYTRAKYDLTLINGTNETTKKDIPYKSDISKYLGAPTVKPTSDATFDAWYVDSSFTEKYTSGSMPKGNLVLYAHWNNAAYDVTFKDGQEVLDTVEVNSGELVSPISTPEKAGYSFTGWYIDETCTQRYDFQRKVEADFDLYAGWSMHSTTSYQILYVTSEGDPVADSVTGNGVIGDTIQANAVVPTIAGYEDYIVDKATASISLDADPNKNVIRFIYSSPESLRYTVQYWYEDKMVAEEANIASKFSSFRCYPNTDLEQLTGYKVKEAYKNVKLTTGENIIKFTLTLNEYTITYENVDYNDIVWENGNTNPTKYNICTNSFALKNPGRVGYTFMGWKLVKGSVESGEYDSKNVVIETGSRGNLTFKAEWTVDVNQKLNYSIKYYKSEQPDKEIGNLNKSVLVASPTVKYADVNKTYSKPSGYILDKVEFGGQTVSDGEMTITDTDNIIKVYYKVDETQKLKYSVEYYIDGKDTPFDKLDNQEVLVADPVVSEVADSSKVPAGYTRDRVLPELPATISETAKVIKVYYKVDETQKLKYSVEYYVNGNDTPFDKLENQEVLVADPVVSEVADSSKVPAGYTRDRVLSELPTTISVSNNIIQVYYKVDETQKLKYSVEYYVTGNDTAFDKLENQEVLVADPVVRAVADSSKMPVGYTRDSVLPELPATISETANVIKVYYRVDETQKLKYSVEYYVNGNDTAFDKLENQEVLVADPVVKAVADSSKVPAGYTRDYVSPELPATITESSNIIKVYYRIDTAQKLKFDVEYYLIGEKEAFDAVRNQTVFVANPVINAVADSGKVPAGYERAYVTPQLPTIISKTNNVIRVYYKVDETQKLKYSIEYYVNGNDTAFDKLENQEVLVADPVVKAVADSSKVPAGYMRDSVSPGLPVTISSSNNVIRVYYKVDEKQKLKYSVEYYVNGNDTAFDKLENQEVLVADPVVKAVADSGKVPVGYTRDYVSPELPMTISSSNNVIKVYYKVDETQKLKYSVEYYVTGNDTAFDKLENQEVLVADPVVKAVTDSSKVAAGYERASVIPQLPTIISKTNNVIRVYYKVDETQKLKYSIEYYVNGNDTAFDKLENQEVLVANPVVSTVADSSKVPAGYTRDRVLPELPTTISESNKVIRVYYKVDEMQKLKYSVEYYLNGNDTAFDKLENQEVLVADPVVKTVGDSSKVPVGYTRDRILPELPATISETSNVIKVYYRVDETQKLKYSVEYYVTGNDTAFDKLENQEVLVADPVVKAVADSSKVPAGHTRDSVSPKLPTTISSSNNVIRVYYKVDEMQKLKYSVEYYVTGNDTAFDKLENQEVLVADPVVKAVADSSKVPVGYTRDRILPELPATISETANVIKVYYRVDETQKLKYSVEYYVNGNDTAFDKLENQEVLVADPVVKAVADSSKVPVGYTRDYVSPKLPTAINSSNNVIKVYYKVDETQKLKYSVEYYVTGNDTAFDKLENQEVLVADPVVKAVADSNKVPAGYRRDSVSPELPATITESSNIIKVYYRIDTAQKLKFDVEYYLVGEMEAFDAVRNQTVLVANPVINAVADSSKVPAGYERASVTPQLPTIISKTNNVIRVYYKVDETQKLKYSIEYYVNGNDTAFDKLENQEVLVANPVVSTVADSSKVPAGYTRDRVLPELPTTISESNKVIRVYYKVDEMQKLKYSVEYYLNGNDTAFDKLENQEVLVADPVVKTVGDSSKVPVGYTRDRILPELPATISETSNVIKVYYRVDETQKLKYSVEYYVTGNDTAFDKLENQEVLVADPVVKAVADSSKVPAGYTRDSVSPKLPTTISSSNNIIRVYYKVDETQKLKYSVEYYVTGNDTAFDKLDNQEVLVADPVVRAVADSSKMPAGYTRDSILPELPATISETANVIKVYYRVDETQKLKYSVEYYVTGNDTAFDKLDNQEVLLADPVVKAVVDSSKVPAGYTRDSVLPKLPTMISETANVIKVYYRVDETQKLKYSVEYYVTGNDTAFDKLENQEVLVADPVIKAVVDSSKVPAGYTRDSVSPKLPTAISSSNNIIRVYYKVDETQNLKYSVEYYVTGNDTAFDKLDNQEVLVANPVVNTVADSSKVPAGYTRNRVLPELPTMISESNNIIKVYYSVDETQKLKYNVEYYINGSATAFDKLENQEVLVADPYVLFVKDSTLVSAGYVRDRVEPLLPAKIVHDGDIIKVYYRARTDLYSEINYYYDDRKTDTQKDNNAVFGTGILDGVKVETEVTHTDGKHYVLDRIEGKEKKVTVNPAENIVNIYYALDEKGTGTDPNKPDNIPDKYQITFTYVAGENGNVDGLKEEVITRELDADGSFSSINPAYPGALVKAKANNGYSFQNWTSDEVGLMAGKPVSTFADEAAIREAGFITDTVFTAHFNAKEDTSYRIEYYYEVQGQYPATTNNYEVRTGKTDTTVSATDNDKIKAGYKYDTEAANVVSGVVKGDNSLVLRLYFKQQFTVTYQSGNHDFFEEQVIGENSYGDKTPVFTGEMNIRGNYVFNGWLPVIAEKVTENAIYVAQWRYTGSSGGDTGGGNTPSDNKPYVPNGPGETVTIEPGDVPLANVPESGPADNLMLIDDGNVPLAGLPKTGDRFGTNTGLVALLTGFLLAAFTALNNKRREEESK